MGDIISLFSFCEEMKNSTKSQFKNRLYFLIKFDVNDSLKFKAENVYLMVIFVKKKNMIFGNNI